MSNNIASPGEDLHVAAKSVDYFSILTETIQNTERNSAQLRALVYERARFHLKREILFGNSSLGLAELIRHIDALELAIARIETNAVDQPQIARPQPQAPKYQKAGSAAALEDRDASAGTTIISESATASEGAVSSESTTTSENVVSPESTTTSKSAVSPESTTTSESAVSSKRTTISESAASFENLVSSESGVSSASTENKIASEPEIPRKIVKSSRGRAVEILPAIPSHGSDIERFPVGNYIGDNQSWEINRYVRTATRVNTYILIGFLFIGLVFMGGAFWYFQQNSAPSSSNTFNERFASTSTQETALVGALKEALVHARDAGAASVNSAPKVSYPLPTSFGIYALHNNKLTELETLPISVPDPRVALSAEIKKPSALEISDTKPAFILFRRDLLNNAPQKITLRVIARMARETKVVDGKPTINEIENTWRIRNISRELNVAPIPGQPEMVIAHLDEDTPLATGRYAIIFNRVGYDFTIKGPVQSLDFCLESFETLDGNVFNQCRTP